MRFKTLSLLLSLSVVSAAGILSEQRAIAQACPNGKKCNQTADCTHTCIRSMADPPPNGPGYVCYKSEAHASPGKNCGDGDKADNCADDKSVICGKTYAKPCANQAAGGAADCTGAPFTGNDTEAGCT